MGKQSVWTSTEIRGGQPHFTVGYCYSMNPPEITLPRDNEPDDDLTGGPEGFFADTCATGRGKLSRDLSLLHVVPYGTISSETTLLP